MDLCNSLGMLLKSIFHQKITNVKQQISSNLQEVDSSAKFIWKIENFSKLNPKGHCSDVFTIGGRTWKVVLFQEVYGNYSAMLELVDGRPSTDLLVEFSLAIASQTDKNNMISEECIGQLLHLTDLCNPDKGYIVNDTCIAEVRVSLYGGSKLESEQKGSKRSAESLEHPCVQLFEEIDADKYKGMLWDSPWDGEEEDDSDSKDDCDSDDYEKVGGVFDSNDEWENVGRFNIL